MTCLAVLAATLSGGVAFPPMPTWPSTASRRSRSPSNLPADADKSKATSSEIIAASEDGNTLVYSDSPYGAVGFIDITDPKAPKAGGIVKIDGEPTSVAVAGGKVLAGVQHVRRARPSRPAT